MKLLVGLGNPGRKYHNTRHNIGFMAMDWLSQKMGIPLDQKKKKNHYGKGVWEGYEVVILKPQTFMNLSGESVLYMASFMKIPPEDIIVVSDDFNLQYGKLRIRKSGSDGGHNGIFSVIEKLKSRDFIRVRMGIGGADASDFDAVEYVLEPFSAEELRAMPAFVKSAGEAVMSILLDSVEKAMNEYNGKPAFPSESNG